MGSVKTYFKKTATVPVKKSYFLHPIRTTMNLHIRPMTKHQKYRHVKIMLPCPEECFQDLCNPLPHDPVNGLDRTMDYSGNHTGPLKPSAVTRTRRRWNLKVPLGHIKAIHEFFSLEKVMPKRSLGSGKLVPRRGEPKGSKIERMAMAFGPLKVNYSVSTVRCSYPLCGPCPRPSRSLTCAVDTQEPFAVGRITLSFWVGLCDPLRMQNIMNYPEQSASQSRPGNRYPPRQKAGLRKAAMHQFKQMCLAGTYNIAEGVESALDTLLQEA